MNKILQEIYNRPEAENPLLNYMDERVREVFTPYTLESFECNFEDIPENDEIPTVFRNHYFNLIKMNYLNKTFWVTLTWVSEGKYQIWILSKTAWINLGSTTMKAVLRLLKQNIGLISNE